VVVIKRRLAKRPSEVFSEQMRIQRARKGWTQRQLAGRLATLGVVVHPTTIGKWEGGERRISLDEALAISIALDVALAHLIAGSYSELVVRRPSIALSRKTPAVSARQLRLCIRGQQPLWGQDERRYFTEVAPDEWLALQRPGVAGLLRAVQELVDACADDDAEAGVEIVEVMSDELDRQHRAFARELREKARRPILQAR
jgi:transcriptional regulator with XRE-family HTH domain